MTHVSHRGVFACLSSFFQGQRLFKALKRSDDNGQQPEPPANHNAISEFYDRYETPVHLAGGAAGTGTLVAYLFS